MVNHCHINAVRYEDGYPAGGDDAIKLGSDLSLGKARPSENIEFKNVRITAKGGHHPASQALLDPEENDERFPRRVGAIPAYAWYLRHVRNARFVGCRFVFEKNDDRPALVIDDGENVIFEQCDLQKGADCPSRVGYRSRR